MIVTIDRGSSGEVIGTGFRTASFDPMPSISGMVHPGRRLRALCKVVCHFFRNGKLGLKLAIKIPFFREIEISFETDRHRGG